MTKGSLCVTKETIVFDGDSFYFCIFIALVGSLEATRCYICQDCDVPTGDRECGFYIHNCKKTVKNGKGVYAL